MANTKRKAGVVKGLGVRKPALTGESAGVPRMPWRFEKDRAYKAVWKELVDWLAGAKVLTARDGVALEMLTVALVNYREVEGDLRKNGYTHTTKNGYEQIRPCVTMCNLRQKQLRGLLEQFGLTPASRSRAERTLADKKDALDAFLDD